MNAAAREFLTQVPTMAEKIHAQFESLCAEPCADKCDLMHTSLYGAIAHLVMLRAELLTPKDPAA